MALFIATCKGRISFTVLKIREVAHHTALLLAAARILSACNNSIEAGSAMHNIMYDAGKWHFYFSKRPPLSHLEHVVAQTRAFAWPLLAHPGICWRTRARRPLRSLRQRSRNLKGLPMMMVMMPARARCSQPTRLWEALSETMTFSKRCTAATCDGVWTLTRRDESSHVSATNVIAPGGHCSSKVRFAPEHTKNHDDTKKKWSGTKAT